jgi:hypothetical protein
MGALSRLAGLMPPAWSGALLSRAPGKDAMPAG